MTGFIDFHCHLLPALDDGAIDLRESLEMARILAGFGFSQVHCTPHLIPGGYENLPPRVLTSVELMQNKLDEAGIELHLIPGTEHYLTDGLFEHIPGALTFGASRGILVEAPFRSDTAVVSELVKRVISLGFQPLIAHPERCSAFFAPRGMLDFVFARKRSADNGTVVAEFLASGCRFQGNLGSFAGSYGPEVKERALTLLTQGGYACLGSDAHKPEALEQMLRDGYRAVVDAVGEASAQALLRATL